MLNQFYNKEEFIKLKEESVMIALAAIYDILIPTNYKEAINDLIYKAAQHTAINLEIRQLLTNNTQKEKVLLLDVNLINSK